MRGSSIYRIGYERWLRNIAVALGNAPHSAEVIAALTARREDPAALVREHVAWALEQHAAGLAQLQIVDEPRLAETRRREHHERA